MNSGQALARLAAAGLPGADTSPASVDSLDELLVVAEAQHVLPWVAAAVEAGGLDRATDDWRRRLHQRHLAAVQTTMGTHAALINSIRQLHDAGVDGVCVLKGCATGHLDYSRPTDRFSSDVDLLVASNDFRCALAAFPRAEIPPTRRAEWQRRYGKASTLLDEPGVEIDMHTMLGQGYFGLAIPLDDLMGNRESFSLGGLQMYGMDGANRLIHAAHHIAASAYTGLHSRRDVLQLVLVSGVDWQEAIDRASRWGVDALVARGIVAAWSSFDVESHPVLDWAIGNEATGRQRLALRISDGRLGGHHLTAPLALPPHRWPGYVLPLLFPSRGYLAHRGGGWTTRLRSAVRSLKPG